MPSFVISRTPYRVSLFGGGTDYPVWYRENLGAVLATSIDKYCYLLCRWLPPFFPHKHFIAYSEIERPQEIDEIRHPVVREVLRLLNINDGVGIHHAGDLPARAGMGTSAAFTVGLLNALHSLKGVRLNKMALALEAIHVEQEMVKESVGSQDQTTSALGGLNRIDFAFKGGNERLHDIKVTPIKSKRVKELEQCLMLFFTGFSRTASDIAKEQIERVADNRAALNKMYSMVGQSVDILSGDGDLTDFGRLMDENWKLKRTLGKRVSTEYIDFLYNKAITAGATGGKLLGAGGGGFLLFFVEPELQANVKSAMFGLLHVPFKFESDGSKIVFGGRND